MKKLILPGLMAALAAMPAVGFAQDWPMFMGDARHTGITPAPAPEDIARLKPVWRHVLPGQVSASPVVAGNLLYIASENGNLYAFDPASKKQVWLYHAEAGIGSTPAIADGRLYMLSRDGFFYALDAATGKLLWRFATGGEARFGVTGGYGMAKTLGPVPDPWDFYLSSPLVQEGRVYFGSSDHHVYALDAISGRKLWAFEADDSVHGSPAYAEGRLFVTTWGTKLYALDSATGAKLWDFQGGKDAETGIFQGMSASPGVDEESVYIGSRDGYVRAFDARTGQARWTYDAERSWVLATAAIDADTLYVPTSDTTVFLAIDKRTGKEKYRTDTKVWTYTSPAIVGGRYAFTGTMTGDLYALDTSTGEVLWHFQTAEGQADAQDIIDDKGKLRMGVLFPEGYPPQAGVEAVKALGAFVASPVWSGNQLITVTSNGEIIFFGMVKE